MAFISLTFSRNSGEPLARAAISLIYGLLLRARLLRLSDFRTTCRIELKHRIDVTRELFIGNCSTDEVRLLTKELYVDHWK